MTVTRANVEATKAFIRARVGNPYVYGGALSNNVKQGTDCSEVWQTVLEMVHGRWVQGRQAEGATTESYRYIPAGGIGPFGTIAVRNWRDIPADAAAKIAFHHGPGGGAASHMWGELDGMRIESNGDDGLVTGGDAMPIDSSYATAWAYLPGPIVADGTPIPPEPVYLGQHQENYGDRVRQLQEALNRTGASLDADGEFGPLTEAAVRAYQQSNGLDVDGVAGPVMLTRLGLTFGAPDFNAGDADDVLALATGLPIARAREILAAAGDGLNRSVCTNPNRIAMWLAQIGHESAGFNATEEYEKGDGGVTERWKYLGRTWIQLTWKSNYAGFSQWCFARGLVPTNTYFVDNPAALADLKWAGLGAAYYWTVARPDINALSDARDLITVTKRINGGTNGLPDRQDRYNRALAVGDQLLTLTAANPNTDDDEEDGVLHTSRSIYRTSNKRTMSGSDAALGADATSHMNWVESCAIRGEQWALDLVAATANGGVGATKWWEVDDGNDNPGIDPWAVQKAKNVLLFIASTNPTVLQANGASS